MLARLRWLATCYTILSTASPVWLGFVAMVAGQIVKPAEAEDKEKSITSSRIADVADGQPLTVVISLNAQKIDIYRGTMLIASSQVSSGKPGYATPVGAYSILEKRRWHEFKYLQRRAYALDATTHVVWHGTAWWSPAGLPRFAWLCSLASILRK